MFANWYLWEHLLLLVSSLTLEVSNFNASAKHIKVTFAHWNYRSVCDIECKGKCNQWKRRGHALRISVSWEQHLLWFRLIVIISYARYMCKEIKLSTLIKRWKEFIKLFKLWVPSLSRNICLFIRAYLFVKFATSIFCMRFIAVLLLPMLMPNIAPWLSLSNWAPTSKAAILAWRFKMSSYQNEDF